MANMDKNICEEIRLIDNILQAEDFIRLRIQAGFAEIPVEHARKALRNGLINVSAIYNGGLVGMETKDESDEFFKTDECLCGAILKGAAHRIYS